MNTDLCKSHTQFEHIGVELFIRIDSTYSKYPHHEQLQGHSIINKSIKSKFLLVYLIHLAELSRIKNSITTRRQHKISTSQTTKGGFYS